MAKLTNYLFLISGLMLTFWAFGLISGGFTDTLLDVLINPTQTKFAVVGLIGVIGVAAAGILGFVNYRPDLTIFATVAGVILGYGWDLLIIFNTLKDINVVFATMIISPLLIVYVVTCLEWWRGITT